MKKSDSKSAKVPSTQADGLGRRDFARLVTATLAGTAVAGTHLVSARGANAIPRFSRPEQETTQPPLSSSAQAEVEAKLRHIEATFGSRLNDDQKKLLRRTVTNHVRMLEAIRPIHEENGDAPATVLKLLHESSEREATARHGTRKPSSSSGRGKGKT